jgi:hypothetical protein
MKELLAFIIEKITGSKDFKIVKEEPEAGRVNFDVLATPDIIGLIIGKEGNTIKNIRRLLAIVAIKENTSVNISVSEK